MDTTVKLYEEPIVAKSNGVAVSKDSLPNGSGNGYSIAKVQRTNGTSINELNTNGAEPRGYVYLWDMDPIPLHELSLYPDLLEKLPDHTQLPETDGEFVKSFQEHPQSVLLTTSLRPILDKLHPDQQYIIGQDSGIYWRLMNAPLSAQSGVESPDWYYVPNVPPNLGDGIRRSYAVWKELVPPTLAIEFVSGDGSEERDRTPYKGKFWVYENAIQPMYYAIYEVNPGQVELYHLVNGQYQQVPANRRGHYPIPSMGIELGIWQGKYGTEVLPWLRVWDLKGELIPHAEEQAKIERQQKLAERQQRRQAEERARQAEEEAEVERQRTRQAKEEAEVERQRADDNAAEIAHLRALLAELSATS